MLEREIKLHVPSHQRARLEQELLGLSAARLPLHACYFDTETHQLAKAKIALRLRKEGEQWVQTIKAPGPDELSRIEINHNRPKPTLDLSVYHGSAIEQVMAQLDSPLQLRYETRVERLLVKQASEKGIVELAYDQGSIKAGALEFPLYELELELVSGDVDALFELAPLWLKKYSLILDLRSKAERGEMLAHIAATTATHPPQSPHNEPMRKPRRATKAITLTEATTLDEAYRLCASDCMSQIIRNACFLAGVDSIATASAMQVEYLHQLRVGIRRLRSCWKFFSKWVAIDEIALNAHLHYYFSQFGEARDGDVIAHAITPRLLQAGMPELTQHDTPKYAGHTPAMAASPAFQLNLLTLLDHLVSVDTTMPAPAAAADDTSQHHIGKVLSKRLNKRLKRLCRQGAQFHQLSVADQHRLRKRIKGLRYSMEFSSSLLTTKSFTRLRAALEAVQHTMGDLNDLYIAHDYYQSLLASQPSALFATGWIRAMQEQKIAQTQTDITQLAKAGRFKYRR